MKANHRSGSVLLKASTALGFFSLLIIVGSSSFGDTERPALNPSDSITDKHMNTNKSGVITVSGATLHYLIEGEGVPCLVIGSSIMYPRTFSKDLRKHVKFIFLDARHFVPSDEDFDVGHISAETYTSDIEKARVRLNLGKIYIVGHSIHGDLALEYARHFPHSVSGVILIASPPVGMTKVESAAKAFWDKDASDERKEILKANWDKAGGPDAFKNVPAGEALIRTYVTNGPKYWYQPAYDCSWMWAGMHPNGKVLTRLFEQFKDFDLLQGSREITAPVFLALGRYDYVVPYILWANERQKLPNLSYNLFERSGHTPQLEEPDLFNQKLVSWLSMRM